MNDIPDWAGKRACELLNETSGSKYTWPRDRFMQAFITVAKLVMQHEQPPVDPDEEAVKRIIARACKMQVSEIDWGNVAPGLGLAVSQYKQEKANG